MENKVQKEELFIPKTKHKGLKIIIGVFLIVGLIVGGYFLYQYKFNNPKTIVNNLLEDAKANVKENITTKSEGVYKVDGLIKVDTNISEEYEFLKDLDLHFNGEVDVNNSLGNLVINTKYKDEKLLDMKTYFEKNIFYILLDGVYDKYLKVSAEDQSVPSVEINPKDMQVLSTAMINALKTEVNKLNFKKQNATITIDGKETNVIDNYVELKDNEIIEFIKNIISDLKEDKEFVEVFNKLTGGSNALDDLKSEINGTSFEGTYKISFYTDKGLFKKNLVSVRQTITVSGISLSFDVDKISDDEINMAVSVMGVVYSIRIKANNSVVNIKLNMNALGAYLKAEINMNCESIKEVTKPDVSNNKSIDELTAAENEEISKKLSENKVLLKLMEKINGTVSTKEDNSL